MVRCWPNDYKILPYADVCPDICRVPSGKVQGVITGWTIPGTHCLSYTVTTLDLLDQVCQTKPQHAVCVDHYVQRQAEQIMTCLLTRCVVCGPVTLKDNIHYHTLYCLGEGGRNARCDTGLVMTTPLSYTKLKLPFLVQQSPRSGPYK